MTSICNFQLRSSAQIPSIAFGVSTITPSECIQIVHSAIKTGFRHFDSAHLYLNDEALGQALDQVISEGSVTREEIFLCHKLWCTHFSPANARQQFEKTLSTLKLNYIDLYLLHNPVAIKDGATDLYPVDANGRIIPSDTDYLDAWRVLEDLRKQGLVRHIGVSNFNRAQIDRLTTLANDPPEYIQCESQPYFQNERLFAHCRSLGIQCAGYSLFRAYPRGSNEEPKPLTDPLVCSLAKAHNRTPAQILIRWSLQRGVIPIVKSASESRMREMLEVHDFELSSEEMLQLATLERGLRANKYSHFEHLPEYPFKADY